MDAFAYARERLRSLTAGQLRQAVPMAADLGASPDEIRSLLDEDVRVVEGFWTAKQRMPERIGGAYAPRLARLEQAGLLAAPVGA